VLSFANLRLHLATREVFRGQRRIDLTTREFEVLLLLLRQPRHVLSREYILEQVWGSNAVDSNAVEVYIGRLRDKLEALDDPRLIQTIRGAGYSLREED
jgi:two-component system, OmpR family, response regulator MprA